MRAPFYKFFWSVVCILASCARAPITDRSQALRAIEEAPPISDDLTLSSLLDGIENQIRYLKVSSKEDEILTFGERQISKSDYTRGLEMLVAYAKRVKDGHQVLNWIRDNFDFYEVYGNDRWGEIFLTSYFEPVIQGSRKKTSRFSEPLLKKPDDLVEILIKDFDERFKDIRTMRGRLLKEKSKSDLIQIGPFYNREEINKGALTKRKLEICWVEPIDAFFLQIQGSGTVILPDKKEIRVGYAEQNGHVYKAIGKYLIDVIPIENMTMQAIEAHLRTLSPEEIQQLLNKNPSYVFFRTLDGPPLTTINSPVTPGRTIATDWAYFPKGTLAFLRFQKPRFESIKDNEPLEWLPTGRFVLDQDTGGAIRGPGRVDLFSGRGPEAKQMAGVIKDKAQLYYLAPKNELLYRRN